MKTCKNCGTEMKDDAVFCTECGEKMENEKKPSANKKGIIGVAALVGVVVIAVLFLLTAEKKFNLTDYYYVFYNGAEGNGQAVIELDAEYLTNDICEKKGYSYDSKEYQQVIEALSRNDIKLAVTPNSNLSNGDKIEVSVEVQNEKMIKGVKLIGGTEKVEVQGLMKYKEITDEELFQNLYITYEDFSPYLQVSGIQNLSDDNFLSTVQYHVENEGPYANGDTLTVTASWDDSIAESNQCKVVGSGRKGIEIEGQPKFILTEEDLTEDIVNQIKEKVIKDYKDGGSKEYIELKELYLIARADRDNVKVKNELYALIEVKPSEHDLEEGETTQFYRGMTTNVCEIEGQTTFSELYEIYLRAGDFSSDTLEFDERIESSISKGNMCYDLMKY